MNIFNLPRPRFETPPRFPMTMLVHFLAMTWPLSEF
jgi:hypothetical protein